MFSWLFKVVYCLFLVLFLTKMFAKWGWVEREWVHGNTFKITLFITSQILSLWGLYGIINRPKPWVKPALLGILFWSFITIIIACDIFFKAPRSWIIGLFSSLFFLEFGVWLHFLIQNRRVEESEEGDF